MNRSSAWCLGALVVSRVRWASCTLALLAAGCGGGWTPLFDGKSLGGWKSTPFGGEGKVEVEDGRILLPMGNDMTGITWSGELPRIGYEIRLEAMKVDGSDFFCGLTFPYGESHCSLVMGGWSGSVTGLSSIDGFDASENNFSQQVDYVKGRWYRVRVRCTKAKIEVWLDEKPLIEAETADHKIGIRIEMELSKPLGIATWRTTGAVRNIEVRKLP